MMKHTTTTSITTAVLFFAILSYSHGFAPGASKNIQPSQQRKTIVDTNSHVKPSTTTARSVSAFPSLSFPSRDSAKVVATNSPLFNTFSSLRSTTNNISTRSRATTGALFSSAVNNNDAGEDSNDFTSATSASTSTSTSTAEPGLFMNIREKIAKISNIASMLCVIDCTVLPIVTVLLPLIGLGASPAQAKWLHELGHSVAIFFVLPVGGLAATMNYLSSKNTLLSSIAALGLSMIYAANGHGGPILSRLPHDLAHSLHCGTLLHKTVNIIGCACLLSSNYLAHKLSCNHNHGGDDGHSHTHSHSHSHSSSCCDNE